MGRPLFLTKCRRSGLTLPDVLFAVALLILIGSLFVPAAIRSARNTAGRVVCASNLRQIGQAMLLYSAENGGEVPRVRYDPAAAPTAYTGSSSADPFASTGPAPNDVTAALYLLIRTQDVDPQVFNCDKSWQWPMAFGRQPSTAFSNFPGGETLSYSFHNPYTDLPPSQEKSHPYKQAEFAVAADINPGTAALLTVTPQSPMQTLRQANSPNHDGDGQNVLFGDGHVSFEVSPFVGIQRDNIYSFGRSGDRAADADAMGIVGAPVDVDDSVLLPVAVAPRANPRRVLSSPIVIGGTISIALITWGFLHRRRVKRKQAGR